MALNDVSPRCKAMSGLGATADIGRCHGLDGSVAFDPNVWSGRALQENFVELAASGLASMYPAFSWSIGSWPQWISARVPSH